MRHPFRYAVLALLLILSCQSNTDAPEPTDVAETPSYTIEQFMDNVSVGGGSFSADGQRLLVHSNKSGIYNVYTMPTSGGDMTPITQSDSTSIFAVSYFPEDDRILLRKDNNGDEIYHLYVRQEDGTMVDLVDNPEARVSFFGWGQDGKRFFYTSTERVALQEDLYEMEVATLTPKLIYKNDDAHTLNGLSRDRTYLAYSKSLTMNNSDLYVRHLPTGKTMQINTLPSKNIAADFSPDGRYLYYVTDAEEQFARLMRYDLKEGTRELVSKRDWDINYAQFSHEGTYMLSSYNVDGHTEVDMTEVATGNKVHLPDMGAADITYIVLSDDEKQAALFVGGSKQPTDLYTYKFETQALQRLTENLNPDINPDHLVAAKVVRFKSFDGLEIPAIYWKPHQASADHKVPALVMVHGGPGGQTRATYRAMTQFLVNHGYAVLGVNNRGSSGYGKDFYEMDNQDHGEADLRDCIAGKDWLATQPYIDSSAIGIIGGSYGGFMVMRAMTHTPEEFAVGVNLYGVTNWLRTLRSIPPWWESFRLALYEEMGDPNTADSVRLYNISPVHQGAKVRNPVMVLQGGTDPRVLQVESDEMVEAMRAQGVPVEYVLFEDEGHGFIKKENQQEAYSKILAFLDKYLKPGGNH